MLSILDIEAFLHWCHYTWQIPSHYGLLELSLLLGGFWFWVVAYCLMIRGVLRHQILEMPMGVGPGNLAWEIVWSFFFMGELGVLFQWGCRFWLLLDLCVNYFMLRNTRHTRDQLKQPFYRKHFYAIYIFCLLAWLAVVYTLADNFDQKYMGVGSALLINVVMSSLYIQQLFLHPYYRRRGISYWVAWLKMIGTALISCASWILHHNTFLLTLGVLSFVLDITYIYLFATYQPEKYETKT